MRVRDFRFAHRVVASHNRQPGALGDADLKFGPVSQGHGRIGAGAVVAW